MKINANINALQTARSINRANNKVSSAINKLSSGYKINKVSDDPTGTAVSSKIKAQLYGLQLASRNAADGVSLVQTAEGAMIEIQEMVKRMRELAVQAANDTNVSADRDKIQVEIDQLIDAVDSMVDVTEFNQMKLINGRLSNLTTITGYTGTESDGVVKREISVKYMSPGFPLSTMPDEYVFTYDTVPGPDPSVTISPGDFYYDFDGTRVTATDRNSGEKIMIDIESAITAPYTAHIKIEDRGQLKIQCGPNAEQRVSLMIPALSPESLGLRIKYPGDSEQTILLDMDDADKAQKSISILDEADSRISTMRATLGSYQNRLQHLVTNLDTNVTNTSAALSRLQDTDMALTMTTYTLNSVVLQSGIAMLAQANERPQQLLQLLR